MADAVRAVVHGQTLISPATAATPIAELARPRTRLADGEPEGLAAVARRLANRDIGTALHTSQTAVGDHERGILETLHLRSRTEACSTR